MHGGVGDGKGTVDAVVPILSLDPVTFAGLFATTAILAPLLEETVSQLAGSPGVMLLPLGVRSTRQSHLWLAGPQLLVALAELVSSAAEAIRLCPFHPRPACPAPCACLPVQVFRGFLLASLTKFMPVPLAVVLSSLAFGLVHLAPRDFPQLTSLGILLGFTYVRSRNLLTPMLIHGTWNGAGAACG